MTAESVAVADEAEAREARFRAFVAAHRARAVSTAWRLVGGDQQAAEDVAQEAFLKAWKALPRFREDAALSTWFYRILVRSAQDHRRWRSVRERWQRLLGGQAEAQSAPPTADRGLQDRIGVALERLSAAQREVFVLVHLEGFSIQEAAAALGKAPGTLKSHLHRALVALRAELSDLYESGGGGGADDAER